MKSDIGYVEAKTAVRLLKNDFGDKYWISMAYCNKALNWSSIKAEEPLKAYDVFHNGCLNAMDTVEYMEEMDYPASIRAVLSKLPYKLKWNVKACDIQKEWTDEPSLKIWLQFVDNQARILSHPVFGNLKYLPRQQLKQATHLCLLHPAWRSNIVRLVLPQVYHQCLKQP